MNQPRNIYWRAGAVVLLSGIFCAVWAQGGLPPGGMSSGSVTYNATYKLDGGTSSQSGQTYAASAADTSGVWVTNAGVLTLANPIITTSGNTSSQDNSSFYGLNAGLLANAGGSVTVTGGTITTTGVWSVTANSVLTCLTDSAGASGSAIGNIKGNGHTVTYDSSLAANSWLGGKTYTLVNGGTLAPAAN